MLAATALLMIVVLSATSETAVASTQAGQAKTNASFATISAEAEAARDANQLERAAGLYKKALALRPGWAEGWFSLGTIEYDQNDYADAARAFAKVRALDAKAGTARVMLGLCEFELGRDEAALKHIEEGKTIGIADDPQLRHVMIYHEGVLLQRGTKFQMAEIQLRKICADGVENANVARELGMAALRMPGKAEIAEGTPGAEVLSAVGKAECLGAQRKFDEAREEYSEIVKSYPEYPNIHFAYGRFLLDMDDSADAIAEFEKEIANDPKHVFARLEIAAAKYRVDSRGGLAYAEEAVKMNPNFPLGHYLLGLLLVDTGDYQRAIPELETARKGYPNEAQVYFALGNAYARAGRKQDAAEARTTFLRLNQRGEQESEISSYGPKMAAAGGRTVQAGTAAKTPQQ